MAEMDPILHGIMSGEYIVDPVERYAQGQMAGYNILAMKEKNKLAQEELKMQKELATKEADLKTSLATQELDAREKIEKRRLEQEEDIARKDRLSKRSTAMMEAMMDITKKSIPTPNTPEEIEKLKAETTAEGSRADYWTAMAQQARSKGDQEQAKDFDTIVDALKQVQNINLQKAMALESGGLDEGTKNAYAVATKGLVAVATKLAKKHDIDLEEVTPTPQIPEPQKKSIGQRFRDWIGRSKQNAEHYKTQHPENVLPTPKQVATYIEQLKGEKLPKLPMEGNTEAKNARWRVGLDQLLEKYYSSHRSGDIWSQQRINDEVAILKATLTQQGGKKKK